MTEDQFKDYLHESVHLAIDASQKYQDEFEIGKYARWQYDLEPATLTFSNEGVPYVVADIQAVGSISNASKSWLWAWANDSIPDHLTYSLSVVREFGEKNNILKLTESYWEATEEDGWEMSSITNRLIGGRGIYRCPNERGFLFLVLTDIRKLR